MQMPKPDKKGWTNAGGAGAKGGVKAQMFDQMDAYGYDDDYEGYGSRPVGGGSGKKSKKQKKQVQQEEPDEHYEFPEEETQLPTESETKEPEISGPSIQISLSLPQEQIQEPAEPEQEVFQEDDHAHDTIVLETYDNWEDAMDALDTAVSSLEEKKAADKIAQAQPSGKKVPK